MKKRIFLLAFILFFIFTSCKKNDKEVNIYMPDGAPAMAFANVLDEQFSYENFTTKFHIVPASEIVARTLDAHCDLALLPTTAAAQCYSKGIPLQLVSVNVFGNLYIVGTKKISSLNDLVGKKILTTGATTSQMVKYVLKNNDILFEESSEKISDKVALSLTSDASEIIPLLKKATIEQTELYGVLGEPQVTKAISLIQGLEITVDLQEEYKKITDYDDYPQACLVVKKDFLNENQNYVLSLLTKLEQNRKYLTEIEPSLLPKLFLRYDSNLANMTFTSSTIVRSNVRVERAQKVKNIVKKYVTDFVKIILDEDFFANC